MEVSALTHASTAPGLRGPSPLLRLQSDERLIALTRRGQHAAFEALCARYQSRLLSFVRHMLGSREDAEDVLQEVFAAAFNAVLADEREINVRPWLYRIARNRSLNHLRRATAVGVDSMDVHFADHGLSTGDRVLRRESFRELLLDVRQLPETQRTALLLREIDALSYEQIAHAMDTTVPSVKSLLVRARISLAEAAEARKLRCEDVRLELGEAAEGLAKLSAPVRRHVRDCDRCRFFKRQLKENNHALAAIVPVGPLLLVKKLLLAKLSSTASAGSAQIATGASASVGAGAVASAGGAGAGGVFTVGAGALATKAVAGLAAAAIVSAGAVAANQPSRHHHAVAAKTAYVPAAHSHAYQPVVASEWVQPLSSPAARSATLPAHHALRHRAAAPKRGAVLGTKLPAGAPLSTAAAPVSAPAPALPAKPTTPQAAGPPLTQLTTETTQLPATATSPPAGAGGASSTAPGAVQTQPAPAPGQAAPAVQAPNPEAAPAGAGSAAPSATSLKGATSSHAPAASRRTSHTGAHARHHRRAQKPGPARHVAARHSARTIPARPVHGSAAPPRRGGRRTPHR